MRRHRTRCAGTMLLAAGFVALSAAALVRDPTALDADIGAGILTMIGLVTGGIGLITLLVSAVLASRPTP